MGKGRVKCALMWRPFFWSIIYWVRDNLCAFCISLFFKWETSDSHLHVYRLPNKGNHRFLLISWLCTTISSLCTCFFCSILPSCNLHFNIVFCRLSLPLRLTTLSSCFLFWPISKWIANLSDLCDHNRLFRRLPPWCANLWYHHLFWQYWHHLSFLLMHRLYVSFTSIVLHSKNMAVAISLFTFGHITRPD